MTEKTHNPYLAGREEWLERYGAYIKAAGQWRLIAVACLAIALPGADIAGYAGFHDQVDNHYLRIFGSAIMMSLVTGGMSYAVDQVSNTSSDSNSTSVQDDMTAALAAQLGQTTLQLLQKNLNIKPTL
ncbi:MAG: hypothetical protein LBJ64_02220, partial [Deltaproteobacteria bacterium]|nr:hypothetical protein [Deltaproteobacteria bacterium]